MPYLTKAEQALFTQATPASSGIVSSAASIGLGIALGTASNVIYAEAAGFKLKSMHPDITNYTGTRINLAKQLASKTIQEANALINKDIKDGYHDIIDLTIEGMLLSVGGQFAAFRDQLAGTSMIGNSYNGLIQSVGIDPFITRWVNWLARPNIPNVNWAWYMNYIGKMDADTYQWMKEYSGWDNKWTEAIAFANFSTMSIYDLLELKRRGGIEDGEFIFQMKRCKFDGKQIELIQQLAAVKPEPYRTAEFAARGLIDDAQLQGAFKWYGLDADWASVWKKSQQIFPSFDMALSLFWREEISREEVIAWLHRQNVDDATAEHMLILAEPIPPSQDLITMVVREAWEPSNITPAPDVFAKYMKFKGFGKDWSDRYWTAHWLPMPVNLAYANLHRGFWSKEQFDELLRIADYHPRWREAMYNVAFNAPTVRELGYGFDTGAFTQEDIVTYRRWGGLSPVDAKKSAQALVDYRLDAERNTLRTAYKTMYVDSIITKDEFRVHLVMLKTNASAVDLWIERGDAEITLKSTDVSALEPHNVTRSDAQWMYEHKLRDEAWFRITLKHMGYTDASIQVYLDKSNKLMADGNVTQMAPTVKDLSLTQIQDLYNAGIYNMVQVVAGIQSLNYSPTDAANIAVILTSPKPASLRSLSLAQLAELYNEGKLNQMQLLVKVKALGYNNEDALALLDILTKSAYKTLTFAQIQNLYQAGIFNDAQVVDRLVIIGYSQNDALVLQEQMLKELNLSQLAKLYYADKIDYNTLLIKVIGLGYSQADAEQLITIMQLSAPIQKASPTLTIADIDNLYDWSYYDEEELIQQYKNKGYSNNDAMLKTYLSVLALKVPLLAKQYSNGWISEDELYNGLLDISLPFITIGIPESRVNEIMTTLVKNNQATRTAIEKNLTKAEIIKGAKNAIFTPAEAIGMLEDLGYTEDEAYYLLAINKIVSAGDAEGYWQMKQATQLYKHSQGLAYVKIPDELIQLEAQMKSAKAKLKADTASKASDIELGADAVMIAQIESRMNTIISKLSIT